MFFPKFGKHKHFHFTNEDFLKVLEEIDLLKYLVLLQILKPSQSINIHFRREAATNFFICKHI